MHLLFRVLVETKISLHWSNIDSLCRDAGFYNTKFGTVVTCSFWSPVSSIKWRWLSTCLSSSKKKGLLAFLLVDCTSVTWIIWNSRNLVNLFFFSFQGANFRDLKGLRFRGKKVELDPDVERPLLPSKKPLVWNHYDFVSLFKVIIMFTSTIGVLHLPLVKKSQIANNFTTKCYIFLI